jgi:hypothetical protein
MPNDNYIPTKNDQKELLNLLRIREFVVCCSLDYDNNLSLNDKLVLSKCFVSREFIAQQVRVSRHFKNDDDENFYIKLLDIEDIRLLSLLTVFFNETKEDMENCYKKMDMHYEDFEDFMAKELEHSRGEKLNKMIFLYLKEKYDDDMFLYFKD